MSELGCEVIRPSPGSIYIPPIQAAHFLGAVLQLAAKGVLNHSFTRCLLIHSFGLLSTGYVAGQNAPLVSSPWSSVLSPAGGTGQETGRKCGTVGRRVGCHPHSVGALPCCPWGRYSHGQG